MSTCSDLSFSTLQQLGVDLVQPCGLVVAERRELIDQLGDGGLEAPFLDPKQDVQQTSVLRNGGAEDFPVAAAVVFCLGLATVRVQQQILGGLDVHLPDFFGDERRVNDHHRKSMLQLCGKRLGVLIVVRHKPGIPFPLHVKVEQPSTLARGGGDAKVEAGRAEEGDFSIGGRGLLFNLGGQDGNGASGVPILVQVGVLFCH